MSQRKIEFTDEKCRLCELHGSSMDHGCADHMHYHASQMSSDAAFAYRASLDLIFAHVADIHTAMLNIIAAKYGHSVEEMIKTVMECPEWNNLYLHPTLKALTYFPLPMEEMKITIRRKK